MTSRRASTTSLARYANPGANFPSGNPNMDFCNAFWGMGDSGVDVLFARLRGAMRTIDELRNYWKERCAIEEDYSKKMSKLSKMPLGRDEIGEFRNALDSIKLETERQAGFHSNLANSIKTDIEASVTALFKRQDMLKKEVQVYVEKEFRDKQAQESFMMKAREKYEQDCMKINSYSAQATLVQGRDLDKINQKLERAHQTVGANEREFQKATKTFADMSVRWEKTWKDFCDKAQDMEEDRLDFVKDNLWAYANAISTVCVADDESCEIWRVLLEQTETERDMENFVRDYGTGPHIPEPMPFVDYRSPEAIPSSAYKPTTHPAQFQRISRRERKAFAQASASPQDEEPLTNAAGIGSGSRGFDTGQEANLVRRASRSASMTGSQPNGINGSVTSPSASGVTVMRKPTSNARASQQIRAAASSGGGGTPQDLALTEGLNGTNVDTATKVGNHTYKVDPLKDPHGARPGSLVGGGSTISPISPTKGGRGSATDPLAQQLEELQNAVAREGTVRRSGTTRRSFSQQPSERETAKAGSSRRGTMESQSGGAGSSSLATPGSAHPAPVRDYRNSAELVVGVHPSASRPSSPGPGTSPTGPTAVMMMPKKPVSPSGTEHIENVLADYQQSLPGERKSLQRRQSFMQRRSSQSLSHSPEPSISNNAGVGANLSRPPSVGHAGIGAHGGSRSSSPQPHSRSHSPVPGAGPGGGSRGPAHSQAPRSPSRNSRMSMTVPADSRTSVGGRSPSPNSIGIALDSSGRVQHDDMAPGYQSPPQAQHVQQHSMNTPPTGPPAHAPPPTPQAQPPRPASGVQGQTPYVPPPPPLNNVSAQQQRQSYAAPVGAAMTSPTRYGTSPGPTPNSAPAYGQQQLQQQQAYQEQQAQYNQPPPQQQPMYGGHQPQHQQPSYQSAQTHTQVGSYNSGSLGRQQAPPIQQVQQQQGYYGHQHSHSGYGQPPAQAQQMQMHQPPPQQHQQMQMQMPPQQQQYNRSPSPQPPMPATGQLTEDGQPILFYVQALYDYTATIDEEFDFQAGDVIAVTATPEDGWWSGILLDDHRRQRGKHVFPSNFVSLF